MARTYGEIQEGSFANVFDLCDEDTLFVDVGSGRGLITAASVQQGGCFRAVGVEKYTDKLEESQELLATLPEYVQAKIEFILGDFNDHDLTKMLQSYACTSIMMFCNNLAFQQGTNNRYFLPVVDRQIEPQLCLTFSGCSLWRGLEVQSFLFPSEQISVHMSLLASFRYICFH